MATPVRPPKPGAAATTTTTTGDAPVAVRPARPASKPSAANAANADAASPPASPSSTTPATAPLSRQASAEQADHVAELAKAIGKGEGGAARRGSEAAFIDGEAMVSKHTFTETEIAAFCDHINLSLKGDADVADRLPLAQPTALFEAIKDGVLLGKLISHTKEDAINVKRVHVKPKTVHHIIENQNLNIEAARKLGCSIVNIGAEDLHAGKEILVLGVVWQIIRIGLMENITLAKHPEIIQLVRKDEDLQTLLDMSPEDILIRWMNHHLERGGYERQVSNFTGDLKDSRALTIILNQIAPETCSLKPLDESDVYQRAEKMLQSAAAIECRKFVTPADIVIGHPRLNLAFVANLFNTRPGLVIPDENEFIRINKENAAMQEELEAMRKRLAEVDTLRSRNTQLETELEQATSKAGTLEGKLQKSVQTLTKLRDHTTEVGAARDSLQEENERLKKEIEDLKQQVADLKARVEELENELKDERSAVNDLVSGQAQADELRTKVEELEKEVAKEKELRTNAEENVESAAAAAVDSAALESLRKENETLIAENGKLKSQGLKLKGIVEKFKDYKEDIEGQTQKLKADNQKLTNLVKKLKEKLQTLAEQGVSGDNDVALMAKEEEVEQLQAELSSAKYANEKLELLLQRLTSQVERNGQISSQLRTLYNQHSTNKKLAKELYGSIGADDLGRRNAQGSGLLKRIQPNKPPQVLWHVIKDNFVFVYRPEKRDTPQEVLRLDDAIVERTTIPGQHVIIVTVAYPETQAYTMEADTPQEMEKWLASFTHASEWWSGEKEDLLRRQSEMAR